MANCKVIAVTNQKGGVGKTTTTANLGIGLARQNKRVLLIDADAQGSLTLSLGYPKPDELPVTLADIMQHVIDDAPIPDSCGILHHGEGVDLLPANIELSGMEIRLINAMSRESVLRTYIHAVKPHYDYILIDCMPSLGMMPINSLAAADSVIIPSQPSFLSAKGLDLLMQSIAKVKRQINPKLKIDGILFTMVDSRTNEAKEIIACSIQRYAGDYVGEHTVTAVTLPSEDMKGRIIGREGRNIRALEAATGVDLIIDDTPETVILSAYSPLRRQVAKMALERLIQDGRIHPARIEDVVHKCEQELEVQIREVGEQATFDAGVHGIHPELVRFLGQLRYRTSFTQNVLQHSLEVSALCGMMAAELGMDIKKAKRAGLLHDIGKAVDHEVEGPHALIGADLAKKYNESKEILHAIAAHHEDQRPETALAVLVQAADSLSGARPGARKELLESYVKRLEDLENIASEFDGVSKAYAIQAGREIRVMVNSENVDDDQTYMLCKGITGKIEENLTYPGQIRVTVIRERRAVGYAK